jgi:hypothetical protein
MISVIVKVNQMSKAATDARAKHVLWTAWQAMQTDAKKGAGTLTMQRLLPAINALNKQVLDEKLVLPGIVEFQRKTDRCALSKPTLPLAKWVYKILKK